MKISKLVLASLCFSALPSLAFADQVVVTAKNLAAFTFAETNFREKNDGTAANDFEWYENASVGLSMKDGSQVTITYSFPGPRTYQNMKSALMTSLNLIKQNIISYEKLGNPIVCYKTIAFADQQANSLEFTKSVVPCSGK